MTNTTSTSANLSSDKDFIKWDSRFALGITYIDKQHMHLVELCNKLYTEVMESRLKVGNDENSHWQVALAGTLKECVSYVAIHFADEEKLMKLVNFQGYGEHKQRHDEFTRKVLETARNFETISFTDAIKFCKFLYEWILSHIAHEDKLFVKPIIDYKNSQKK